MHGLWRSLAREYEISIVAGTYFARTAAGRLRNRAVVFDEDGRVVHQQDKAFLTPFEAEVLGLEAGPRGAVGTFEVEGVELGMTICRDSFFEVWDERLAGAEMLIELRANGEPYSAEVRRRFEGALPERVAGTGASAGVNSSLTGRFLDLLWEGPSYVVDHAGHRIAGSETVRGSELVVVDLEISGVE
jgi:NAD+ synthase (glutamine-hydrolysing)